MKKLLFLLVFCLPMTLAAQVSIAPMIGLNFDHYRLAYIKKSLGSISLVGAKAGALIDIPLSNNLYLQPGAYYSRTYKSFWNVHIPNNVNNDNIHVIKMNIPEIEVPVNLVFKKNLRGQNRLFWGGGLFVRKYFIGSATLEFSDPHGYMRQLKFKFSLFRQPLDYGLNIIAGYELKNGFFGRLQAQTGFSNLNDSIYPSFSPYYSQDRKSSMYSSNFSVSIGYRISKKTKGRADRAKQAQSSNSFN